MAPFELLDYDAPDLLDRLTGSEPMRNAYVELHNLIAAAEYPHEFGPQSRERIGRAHGVNLAAAFFRERRVLYTRYLDYCLADSALTGEERERLGHLARTLALSVADLEPIHADVWGRTVSDALTDECLSVEERLLLYTMQHTLALAPDHAAAAYDLAARKTLLTRVAHALCDGELSDDEAAGISALAEEIGVAIPDDVRPMMDRAAHRWHLRHADTLEAVEVPVPLAGGEVGYYAGEGAWFELNYYRLKIERAKFRDDLRDGRTSHITVPRQALRHLDDGPVSITNRRLVLSGDRFQPRVLRLSSLLGAERFQNGVRVAKKGTRSLFVRLERDADLFCLVLSRALRLR
ncbi:MAG: hypothetical protein AAGF99_11545 [Bacteroidota bacterium]